MSIRTRLTLWYGAFVAVVLATALGAAYVQHVSGHLQDLERRAPTMEPAAVADARARLDAMAEEQRSEWAVIAAVGVVVALAGGWVIARTALRPIALMTDTARAIADSRRFSQRVPSVGQKDELGTLARTFNEMLESLAAAHASHQRFVADASHELRTPLATIQGNAEILTSREATDVERHDAVVQILRESMRLSRLTSDLLVLARADAGPEPLAAQDVPLDDVLMEAFEELRPMAGTRLHVTALESAVVRGERDRLKQLVLIVLDNALRYTPTDGAVEAALQVVGTDALLRVDDEGIGVTGDVVARAFERFYRGEAARAADPQGTGLGLAIARWIAERHGGTVTLAPRTQGGSTALLRLPIAAAPAPNNDEARLTAGLDAGVVTG